MRNPLTSCNTWATSGVPGIRSPSHRLGLSHVRGWAGIAKASTTQRGYGRSHQAERERWEPKVKAGGILCARCSEAIDPDGDWDLGHNDDRTAWTGPEHTNCNRSAGGRNGAAVTNAKRIGVDREW